MYLNIKSNPIVKFSKISTFVHIWVHYQIKNKKTKFYNLKDDFIQGFNVNFNKIKIIRFEIILWIL